MDVTFRIDIQVEGPEGLLVELSYYHLDAVGGDGSAEAATMRALASVLHRMRQEPLSKIEQAAA